MRLSKVLMKEISNEGHEFAYRSDTTTRTGQRKRPAKLDSLLWFCAIRVQKMSHLRFASHVTVDALLHFTIRFRLAFVLPKMFCPRTAFACKSPVTIAQSHRIEIGDLFSRILPSETCPP